MLRPLILLGLLLLLPGCEMVEPLFGDAPEMAAAPMLPAEPPAPALPPAEVVTAIAALPMVELWAADRIAQRFETLNYMAYYKQIDPQQFHAWVMQNQGAFLLLTMPPARKGLAAKIPTYEELAAYLQEIQNERGDIAQAQRTALLDNLMPVRGPLAAAARPPLQGDDLTRWLALLDHLVKVGVLPEDSVAAEKILLAQIIAVL